MWPAAALGHVAPSVGTGQVKEAGVAGQGFMREGERAGGTRSRPQLRGRQGTSPTQKECVAWACAMQRT